MDFFKVAVKKDKGGEVEAYPNFLVSRSKDLMIKGKSFYAIWDEEIGLWSTDEYDVQRLVDEKVISTVESDYPGASMKLMRSFDSNRWATFKKYVSNLSDNARDLDTKLVFANDDISKEDYATKRLPYAIGEGPIDGWDILLSTLYATEERAKIEWAIGSVISGDSKSLQKFLVFYGPAGTGKSTVLNIIQKLFHGYVVMFDAKSLGSANNAFSTEIFKQNPLVAIQHDGDLSRIEDNTKLNSIISHEDMMVNEKYKSAYSMRFNAFLFMGTNQPVRISDAKSGLIRRLIDVKPTGNKLTPDQYEEAMRLIDFELGAIAKHCLDVYLRMGRHYYDGYRPVEMMYKTDHVLNFVSDNYDVFKNQAYTTVQQAYSMYKEFCVDAGISKPMSRQRFQSELGNYFKKYHERLRIGDDRIRSAFTDFDFDIIKTIQVDESLFNRIELKEQKSIFDEKYSTYPAQLTKEDGTPRVRWSEVRTTLSDIDTSELHYVKVDPNHIVIDFDLKDPDGEKDLEANLKAANEFPPTYTEVSKSGKGVHLHYIYNGDPSTLSNWYADNIEVKVFSGNASLRRKLSLCNNKDIATIDSGLPLKEKKVLKEETVQSEKGLRDLILRNLKKEIHPSTKSSIDFIHHILEEAYESGMEYDVTDLQTAIMTFASRSTNQALNCMKIAKTMKYKSKEDISDETPKEDKEDDDKSIVFYDVEVYPNLFVVCWKCRGSDSVVRMINPGPEAIEQLMKTKLVGFNNRRYDNHILYARYMGYDNEALYHLSQKIINNDRSAYFGAAYNLSYADIYDYSSKKQGLKKFQIDLGIDHMEMDIPWDKPVPEDMIDKVVEYCVNDVNATEAVFEARISDWMARRILADMSGLTPNHTTQSHTAKIIFGDDKQAKSKFVYTDLRKDFPGYKFDAGVSTYRGEKVGEGGYVYSEPGMYENVAVLDVASMHPTSIENLNLFGEYTKNFTDLKAARIAIKHKDYDAARKMLDGKLAPYLGDESDAKDLSYALKIVINIVYGLTSAKFDNPFKDNRNKDNIVAKRGALFMINLKHEVQQRGFQVVHIKTDSIKIPNASKEIIDFVFEYGRKYGYEFEHESTYSKFCLVNDAVYIAKEGDHWEAVGAQFQHPYVFKKLFSNEPITFDDYCETKNVSQGVMYIDTNYDTPMHRHVPTEDNCRFVGKTGRFTPVKEGNNGGILYRVKDGKFYTVTGTKGHFWKEAQVAEIGGIDIVDTSYVESLVADAKDTINKFGNYDDFVKE